METFDFHNLNKGKIEYLNFIDMEYKDKNSKHFHHHN